MVYEVADKLQLAGSKLVVVDFFATWCGPCKTIAPKIEKISEELKDSVVFLKVDVDKNEQTATDYKIKSMPTFVFIKNKKKVGECLGANESKVRSMVKKFK